MISSPHAPFPIRMSHFLSLCSTFVFNFKIGNGALLPDKITYTSLIQATVNDGEEGFADKCTDLLSEMEAGSDRIKPDIVTYAMVMHAYGLALQLDKAEALVEKMESNDDLPNPTSERGIYDQLIGSYLAKLRDNAKRRRENQRNGYNRNSDGTPSSEPSTSRKEDNDVKDNILVHKALKVLTKMEELYREGNTRVKPTPRTYNYCLQAIGHSSEKSIERAEEVFERFINHCLSSSSSSSSLSTASSSSTSRRYNKQRDPLVVDVANNLTNIYVQSNMENKVHKVLGVLRKMKDHDVEPTVRTYNHLLSACSRLPVNSSQESKAYAIHVAVTTLKFMQDSGDDPSACLSPDSVSYNHMLHACNRCIDNEEERRVAMEAVFQRCCTDGFVNRIILGTLRKFSGAHFWSILGMDERRGSQHYIDINDLDPSWSRNAPMNTTRRWSNNRK